MSMNESSDELCSMGGSEDEVVTHGEHNQWMKVAVAVHLRPMKNKLNELRDGQVEVVQALKDHIRDENALLKKVLWRITSIFATLLLMTIIYIWTKHVT